MVHKVTVLAYAPINSGCHYLYSILTPPGFIFLSLPFLLDYCLGFGCGFGLVCSGYCYSTNMTDHATGEDFISYWGWPGSYESQRDELYAEFVVEHTCLEHVQFASSSSTCSPLALSALSSVTTVFLILGSIGLF